MALLTNTLIETTPVGTTNLAGIINANWSVIEAMLNPALASADARYNLPWKVLTRTAALPSAQARLEWDSATTKTISRPAYAAITYAASLSITSNAALTQYCALTGNVTVAFGAGSVAIGRVVDLIFEATGGPWTITWPVGMRWLAGAAPTSLAAGKQLYVRFIMRTAALTGVSAIHHLEA